MTVPVDETHGCPVVVTCPGCFHPQQWDATGVCPICHYRTSLEGRSAALLPVGTQLKGYVVGEKLGQGGFGITYRGFDMTLKMKVAIKEYYPSELVGRSTDRKTVVLNARDHEDLFHYGLRTFLQEAQTIAQLRHPHLVRVLNFFELNDTAYLVMDYLEGEDLATHLKQQPDGRLPWRSAVDLVLPVLDGLRKVHEAGFMHRDIKPGNLYRTDEGLVLLDFGSARQVTGSHTRSLLIFTEGYAPYEQYLTGHLNRQGPWTDVYGAAATLYFMLTARRLPSALERKQNDLLREPDLLKPAREWIPEVPVALDVVLGRALAVEPEQRLQSMAAFKREMESVLAVADQPLAAVKPRITLERPAKPCPAAPKPTAAPNRWAKRGLWAAVIAVIVTGLAWGGWWWSRFRPTPLPQPAPPAPLPQPAPPVVTMPRTVSDVGFKQGPGGQGVITVKLSSPAIPVDVRQEGNQIIADFQKATLARGQEQRLDVTDFATPVLQVEALNRGGNARLTIRPNPPFEYLAYQANDLYVIEVRTPQKSREEEEKEAQFDPSKKKYTGDLLSLNFQDIEVRALLQILADFTGMNIVVSDSVKGNLTLRLQKVPWDQALDIILRTKGLAMRQNGNVIFIAPTEEVAAREKLDLESRKTVQELITPPMVERKSGDALERDRLRDGSEGPDLVLIKGGCFQMGSPALETGRHEDERQHQVCIKKDFALGRREVTVGEFKRFVEVTGYRTDAERNEGEGCYAGSEWVWRKGRSWRKPGYPQHDNFPVVCVSWNDAMAYTDWLSGQTGQTYRLPTEAEWEYAARARTMTARYWGDDPNPACQYANVADQTKSPEGRSWRNVEHDCTDGYWYPAPVGTFQANAWKLLDMLGNVWEWTCSVYDKGYGGGEKKCIYKDTAASLAVRGGSWNSEPAWVRSAFRLGDVPTSRYDFMGFRLARSL